MTTNIKDKSDLHKKHCVSCEGKVDSLEEDQVNEFLSEVDGWSEDKGAISKNFKFENYYETTSFVNAVAWIAHKEDHHPDISFGYKNCEVSFKTHAINGLSENDFIMASKVDKLLDP